MSDRAVRPMKMIVSILGRGQGNAFVRLLTGKQIVFHHQTVKKDIKIIVCAGDGKSRQD